MKLYALLLGILLLVACTPQETTTPTSAPVVQANTESSSTQQFVVRIINQQPDLDLASVQLMDTVLFEIVNMDETSHVFVVENYGEVQVPAMGSANLFFEADLQGEFAYGVRNSPNKGILSVE